MPEGVQTTALHLSRPDVAALEGVSRLFLYPQPDGIDELLKAAVGAGVERIVLLSSAWPVRVPSWPRPTVPSPTSRRQSTSQRRTRRSPTKRADPLAIPQLVV